MPSSSNQNRNKVGMTPIVFLISSVLAGSCNFQTNGQIERSALNSTSAANDLKEVKSPQNVLFKGDNMTLINSNQDNLKQVQFDDERKSCLVRADEIVERKVRDLGYEAATNYFEFDATQTYDFGSDKFTVRISKDLFSRIDPGLLKEIDKYVGFTLTRNLYFLQSGAWGYLLLIGPESASSGMGHNYRTHLLVPLDRSRPTIDFQSISEDPRRVRISGSGAVYYTQFDPPYQGAIKESASKSLRLTGSMFSVDSTGNKNLEFKEEFACENVEEVFQRK